MRISENINHHQSFSSLWCCTHYSTPSLLPCGPAPSNTHLPHRVTLLIRLSATISWVEMLTPMAKNDIWLWHFFQPTSVWGPGLYSLFASSEPRRVAVILSGCPTPTAHWKDGTSYPSNYTPFLLSWKDISLNFEVDSRNWKYRLSEIVKVLRDGLIQLLHFMEEETEVPRGEMAYSMLQKELWQSQDKNRGGRS